MPTPIRKAQTGDLCLWPDGTWCYYEEVQEFSHKSDDYEIIPEGAPRWVELVEVEA